MKFPIWQIYLEFPKLDPDSAWSCSVSHICLNKQPGWQLERYLKDAGQHSSPRRNNNTGQTNSHSALFYDRCSFALVRQYTGSTYGPMQAWYTPKETDDAILPPQHPQQQHLHDAEALAAVVPSPGQLYFNRGLNGHLTSIYRTL